MGWLDFLFEKKPYPSNMQAEIDRLIDELVRIGQKEDFLSERSGGSFNAQCRHVRAREIGIRLDQVGGVVLMEYVLKKVRRRVGDTLANHLAYAWSEIGKWVP